MEISDNDDAGLKAIFHENNSVSGYRNVTILDFIGAKDDGGGRMPFLSPN